MSTPDTTLDARFSDPAATAAGWDETRRALEDAQLSWICTVRADGRPHLTPLKWDGQWQFEVRDGTFWHPGGGTAQVFEVRPAKVLTFAKGRFGQTRHRFA